MSGEYGALLRERALSALKWAQRAYDEGDYDFVVLHAEYAVQLYLKSILYRIRGEEARGHDARELFGLLAASLMEQDMEDTAIEVVDYVRRHRRELIELSEAQSRATYGFIGYGEREAGLLLTIAKHVIEELKQLENKLFGG